MLNFIYVTDLHGWTKGYDKILQVALDNSINVIINGGDMLPKEADILKSQQIFIEEYLSAYFDSLTAHGIEYYGMFGNDDAQSTLYCWQKLVETYDNVRDLTDSWYNLGNELIIRGCNYVLDHPFGLKDWSVLDTRDYLPPPQFTYPVLSKSGKFEKINDIDAFFRERPTLEEILYQIAKEAPSLEKAILVCHAPPSGTGLGVIVDGSDVGSVAIRRWIEAQQPLLTLHGHIHESPTMSGCNAIKLGRTTVHQPGQRENGNLIYSVIRINDYEVNIKRVKTNV